MDALDGLKQRMDKLLADAEAMKTAIARIEEEQKEKNPAGSPLDYASIWRNGDSYPILNHFMAGKAAAGSYMSLLAYAALLLKPYARQYPSGFQFLERIRQALKIETPLRTILTREMEEKYAGLKDWIQDMQEAGAEGSFAVDTLLLYREMKPKDKGLAALSNFFALLGFHAGMLGEAAEIAESIVAGNYEDFCKSSSAWKQLDSAVFVGYFQKKNYHILSLADESSGEKTHVSIYDTKDRTELQKLASAGDQEAMYELAYRFWIGNGVLQDDDIADAWFEKCFDCYPMGKIAGQAALNCGMIKYKSHAYLSAMDWFFKGIEAGNDWAMKKMGDLYADGIAVGKNITKALDWYNKAILCHGEAEAEARSAKDKLNGARNRHDKGIAVPKSLRI